MKMEEIVQKKLQSVFNDDSIVYDKSRFAGGLTNYNYIMDIKGIEYVIREPGGMTNEMIDRGIEKVNNQIASELGLNSECVYFDEFSGVKISTYIKSSRNIAQADPCSPANLIAVSRLMKKTHSSPKHFSNTFDWKVELDKYEQIVKTLKGDFFFDYSELKNRLLAFEQMNIKDMVLVPCHNDTVPENFIVDEGGRAYLIDWEYSGMNDPSWDVAAYILESKLPHDAIQYLLEEYYGRQPETSEILKIKDYILAQDLLWTVWALIRHYNGEDFLDYCDFRYERFRKNLMAVFEDGDYTIADMVRG